MMENNDSRAKELRAGGKVFHATGSGLVFRPAARVSIFGPLSGWDRARVCSRNIHCDAPLNFCCSSAACPRSRSCFPTGGAGLVLKRWLSHHKR